VDPGRERRATVEPGEAPHHGDEGLLGGVLGIGVVAADAPADGVHPVDVHAQELLEGIPVPCLGGTDQRVDVPLTDAPRVVRTPP
jgi:hypothetical protein